MNVRSISTFLVLLLIATAVFGGTVDTTFTYQGILSDAGGPFSGTVDLRFTMWDAVSAGAQVGPTVTADDVAVSHGRITLQLDFGDVFNGAELWLAVEVRDGSSTGSYALLDPRQALTAAPYAAYAVAADAAATAIAADHATSADSATTADAATTAGYATTAGDSDTLDGEHGSHYLAWSNLTGKPGGLDDGDDDTLAGLSCSSGEVASWNGSDWACSPAGGAAYARTVIVGPVGDAAANGAALIAAVDAIGSPASAADGWLVMVEPGDYDLGGANFTVPSWVHLRGSGRAATRIVSAACGPVNRVISLGSAELSDLTVENTCVDPTATVYGISMGVIYPGARISRVDVVGSGAVDHAFGIYSGSDDLLIEDVKVSLSGADSSVGISLFGAGLFLIDTVAEIHPFSSGCGLELYETGQVVISRGSYAATGSVASEGLNAFGASVDATDCTFSGGSHSIRMYGTDGSQQGDFDRISADGQVWVHGDGVDPIDVTLRHSRVTGTAAPLVRLDFGVGSLAIAGTEIDGPPISGPVDCTAVWDEDGAFYPGMCPPS